MGIKVSSGTKGDLEGQHGLMKKIAEETKAAAEASEQEADPISNIVSNTKVMMGTLLGIFGTVGTMAVGIAGVAAAIGLMMRGNSSVMDRVMTKIGKTAGINPRLDSIRQAVLRSGGGGDDDGGPYLDSGDKDDKKKKKGKGRWGRRKSALGKYRGKGKLGMLKSAFGSLGKMGGRLVGGGGALAGVMAAGSGAMDAYNVLSDDSLTGKEKTTGLSKAGGTAAGGLAGAAGGTSLGAMIGGGLGTLLFPGVGTAIGAGIGGMVGGGLGGWGGSELGESVGEAVAPAISALSNIFTDATQTPGIPTTMPLAAATAAGAGATGAGIAGRPKVGGARIKELSATAGPNSISASGDLTLKITNFQDLLSQAQEKKSSWGIFGF